MDEIQKWDDYRLFLAVAQAQGLVGATLLTGASAATLSRRMHALEKRLTIPLFIRHREGYTLTEQGGQLVNKVQLMHQSMQDIAHWCDTQHSQCSVKVAAGDWTCMFIAKFFKEILKKIGPIQLELLAGSVRLNLGRREACLGIRNSRPLIQGLAGQRIARVEFAIYAAQDIYKGKINLTDLQTNAYDWLLLNAQNYAVPSSLWLGQRLAVPAVLNCSSTLALLEAVKLGAGCAVLPCFIGDAEDSLCRVSPLIADLSHDQWLVCHAEDRDNLIINKVKNALVDLIRSQEELFAGRCIEGKI